MDPELDTRLKALEAVVEQTHKDTHRMWLLAKWGAIITVALIVLPLFFLPFAVNSLLSSYNSALSF